MSEFKKPLTAGWIREVIAKLKKLKLQHDYVDTKGDIQFEARRPEPGKKYDHPFQLFTGRKFCWKHLEWE